MHTKNINSAFNYPQWPVQNVVAISTTCLHPFKKVHTSKDHINKGFGNFNLGLHVGDNADLVNENRQSLLPFLPAQTKIQWLEQVHGNHVEIIDSHTEQALIADAMITRQKNIALAIMTADCLPILLSSTNGDEVAAIHGGWRSLQSGIIEKTLNKMETANHNINAWLGPCIGECAFEVGDEVRTLFVGKNKKFSGAFQQHNSNKFLANLQKIAYIALEQLNVVNISALSDCTFSKPNKYYSYRRSPITGRMATIICRQ